MNTDCFSIICDFMPPSEVVKLSKGYAVEHFPKKLSLTSVAHVEQFNRWHNTFDTSRLEEVCIEYPMQEFGRGRGVLIGDVPPSVKRLTVRDDNFSVLAVPSTVEELVIESSFQHNIDLPEGIRSLELGLGFSGSIRTFPATLEKLTIKSWSYPWGFDSSFPVRLRNIPDTVHTIEIGEAASLVVWRWPTGVQKVVLPVLHWGVNAWLERNHAPIPEGVEVEFKENSPFPSHGPLIRQNADPWDGDFESDVEWWSDEDRLEWEAS
jgi:hypothetical protein